MRAASELPQVYTVQLNGASVAEKRGQRAMDLAALYDATAERTRSSCTDTNDRIVPLRARLAAVQRALFLRERHPLQRPSASSRTDTATRDLEAQLRCCLNLNCELAQRIEALTVLLDDDADTRSSHSSPAGEGRVDGQPLSTSSASMRASKLSVDCCAFAGMQQALVTARMGRSASFNMLQILKVSCSRQPPECAQSVTARRLRSGEPTSDTELRELTAENETIRHAMQVYVAHSDAQFQAVRENVDALEQLLF